MLALFSAALAGHEHGSVLHILRACIRLTEEYAIPPGDLAALSRLPHVQHVPVVVRVEQPGEARHLAAAGSRGLSG